MPKMHDIVERLNLKYKSKLIPCAVCGGTDVSIRFSRTVFTSNRYVYFCACAKSCTRTADFSKAKDAVLAWNEQQRRERAKKVK